MFLCFIFSIYLTLLKVVTPLKTVGIEGQLNNLPNQHHLLLKSFEDNKQALKFDVIVDSRRRNLDIEFNYDQGIAVVYSTTIITKSVVILPPSSCTLPNPVGFHVS